VRSEEPVGHRTRAKPDQTPTVVALFAGGGGLNLGFRLAGFETLLATDFDADAAATFATNLPAVPFIQADIRHLTRANLAAILNGRKVDIVIGGPPCQGFSTLGDQLQGDPRNTLFEAYARIVAWLEPRAILLENTSYLRSQFNGAYEREIRHALESLGYSVDTQVLDAADFGAAQHRRRIFFVGTRDGHPFSWPAPTHGPGRASPLATVGEAIMDIADVERHAALPNHSALNHSERVLARYRLIPEGGRLPPPQELPPEIRRRNFGNTYKRLHRERPSLTLVPGNNAFPVHPTEDRSLTPREGARLQGFPDDYIFAGNRAEQCRLVGNAVPVPLASALAGSLRSHLAGDTESATATQLPLKLRAFPIVATSRGKPLTAVSLFTGAGGLMLGFRRAGFQILGSYDLKRVVAANLALNFPDVPHHLADLGQITVEEIRQDLMGASPDVVFGGPPCQGFSVFGPRRFIHTRGVTPEEDPRNELLFAFADLAAGLSPRVILLENVKGLLSTNREGIPYVELLRARLEAAGYTFEYQLINTADYGVPQRRERVLGIATRHGMAYTWPEPKFFREPKPWQKRWATVGDSIMDLAEPDTYDNQASHVPMAHKPLVVERYGFIPEGGRLPEADLPERLRGGYRTDRIRNFSHVYRRLSRDEPATTLVPGHNAFPVHPTLPRTLTVREAARLQTFPDWFRFAGTRQQQCILVGNAVPPVIADLFAQVVQKAIQGNQQQPGNKADHYELRALQSR
jgi:DNA (cytosine-5)-methyltransferase 1